MFCEPSCEFFVNSVVAVIFSRAYDGITPQYNKKVRYIIGVTQNNALVCLLIN